MKGIELPVRMMVILVVLLLVAIISIIVIGMIYGASNPLLDLLRQLTGGASA